MACRLVGAKSLSERSEGSSRKFLEIQNYDMIDDAPTPGEARPSA